MITKGDDKWMRFTLQMVSDPRLLQRMHDALSDGVADADFRARFGIDRRTARKWTTDVRCEVFLEYEAAKVLSRWLQVMGG